MPTSSREDFVNGLVSWQTRSEVEWLLQRLAELRPKRVLEIGVAQGGTSGLFCRSVGEDGLVVGLDISDDLIDPRVRSLPNHRLVVGDSHRPEVLAQVTALSEQFDFVLIDGDHSAGGVLQDTEMYLPLLREGGLAVWHDIRLDPDQGIKQVWYRDLKRRLFGAFDHYANPHNNGYGVWYKTDKTVEAAESTALDALARGEVSIEPFRRILANDPYRIAAWRGLLEAARRTSDTVAARDALTALALVPPSDPAVVAALRADPKTRDVPWLDVAVDALDAERDAGQTPAGHHAIAMAASEHGFHDVAEARIHHAYNEGTLNIGFLLDRVTVFEQADARITQVVDAAVAVVRASGTGARSGADDGQAIKLREMLGRVMSVCHFLQKHDATKPLAGAVLDWRPDLAATQAETLLHLSVLALQSDERAPAYMKTYGPDLRRLAKRAGDQLGSDRRAIVDAILARAGYPGV